MVTMFGDQEGEDDYHFDADEGRLMLQHATRVAVFFVKPMTKSIVDAE